VTALRAGRRRPTIAPMAERDLYERPPAPPGADERRISRRALFRGQLARWTNAPAPGPGAGASALTARVRAAWEREGHEPLLRALEPVAETLVELAEVDARSHVLDVGAGDGNVALAAARRGATVNACDLAPTMVAQGRDRCPGAVWTVADAQALPIADGAFDAVLSAFGAALAPDPRATARELVRVTRPGGVVALAAWAPRGLPGALDPWIEQTAAWPEGVPSPSSWGEQHTARARLGGLLDELELRTRTVTLRFPSPEACFGALARSWPLGEAEAAALRPRFEQLLASCNNAPDAVEVDARYLLMRGRRPIPQA
jgi:SAM-dependent methyltransferase